MILDAIDRDVLAQKNSVSQCQSHHHSSVQGRGFEREEERRLAISTLPRSMATKYQTSSRSAATCGATRCAISDAIARLPDGIDPAVSLPQQDPPRILGLGRVLRRVPERGLRLVQGSQELRSRSSRLDQASSTASSARWNRPDSMAWRTKAS